jgi:hypothetical protein
MAFGYNYLPWMAVPSLVIAFANDAYLWGYFYVVFEV